MFRPFFIFTGNSENMKHLFFIAFGLLFTTHLIAQNTIVGTNKIWTVAEGGNAGYANMIFYYLKGDSIINGYTYQKLNSSNDASIFNMPFNNLPINSFSNELFREDSSRVIKWNNSSMNECVLLDFNLAIGDTFMQACYGTNQVIVSSIDSIQLSNGQWSKRINFSNGNYWIDRIGARDGMLIDDVFINMVDAYSTTSCVFEYGIQIYHNNFFNDCFFITSLSQTMAEPNIVVYPNPSNGLFRLKNVEDGAAYQIIDILGNVVANGHVKNEELDGDVLNLVNGIYQLQYIEKNHFQSARIIIKQ